MKHLLRNRRGEGYFEVVVTVLVCAMLLVVTLNLFGILTTRQSLNQIADATAEYAAVHGSTGMDAETFFSELCHSYGIAATVSFAGSESGARDRVQYGDRIVITVTANVNGQRLQARADAASLVYWKGETP